MRPLTLAIVWALIPAASHAADEVPAVSHLRPADRAYVAHAESVLALTHALVIDGTGAAPETPANMRPLTDIPATPV